MTSPTEQSVDTATKIAAASALFVLVMAGWVFMGPAAGIFAVFGLVAGYNACKLFQ